MNFFKKKVNDTHSAFQEGPNFNSEDMTLNEAFASLVKKYSETLKDKFTSRDIVSKFKIRDKELQNILSRWIAELVESSEIDLILTGKNAENDYVFIRGEVFERTVKNKLNLSDSLLNENQTYKFLQDISGSRDLNVEILKGEIQRKLKPLVKFDDGSRNMPVMLNLCKFKVPEAKVLINDEVLQKYNMTPPVDETESKKVKKMMFSHATKNPVDDNPEDIIFTAFTLLLQEAGKLILTRDEILKTRAYKVFFSSIDFDIIKQLAAKTLKFSPFIGKDYISFYPENWLDIKVLMNQTGKEGEQSPAMKFDELINKKYQFLSKEDIATLRNIVDSSEQPVEAKALPSPPSPVVTMKPEKVEEITEPEKPEKKQIVDVLPKNSIKKPEKDKLKKKIALSEPLKFLDSIIVNEKLKDSDDEKTIYKIPELKNFDKKEKHYIIRILDSTIVNSGYYSHNLSDKDFTEFLNKLDDDNVFDISEEGSEFIIRRNEDCSTNLYDNLRNKIEDSFLNRFEDKIKPDEKPLDQNKTGFQNGFEKVEKVEDLNTGVADDDADNGIILKTEEEESLSFLDSLIIKTEEEPEEEKIIIDDMEEDSNSFFAETAEDDLYNVIKNNFTSSDDSEKLSDIKNRIEDTENIRKPEIVETPPDEAAPKTKPEKIERKEEHLLYGKIISVLTDDEEKWLKIEMFSKMLGFELRDGLAYGPDIAVFDDNFKHLEPIAKNSGAMIMPIENFMQIIGLGKTEVNN
jgi:hypothetical protein